MALVDLTTEISGLRFKSPLFTASGTAGYGSGFLSPSPSPALGAFITKGISLHPRKGNPPPRIHETPCGLLNAIGLENIGLKAFIDKELSFFKDTDIPLIVNIFGKTIKEMVELSVQLTPHREIRALELNVSCPNVQAGGIAFGQDPQTLFTLVQEVTTHCSLPLWVKLPPHVTAIETLAKAAEDGGASALTIANTYPGIAIDHENEAFCLGNITGGLSGPAIKPLSQYAVWKVARQVHLPIIASGGCSSAKDALEYFLIGARAIEIGTFSMINPGIFAEIFEDLQAFFERKGISSLSEWIGRLL